MKKLVIMPGGFHPFHQGHLSLYNAAKRQFPDADVYVAATNDTSKRPFPFEIKAKLAQLAGVDPGHFIQVKSPFRPDEITKAYNPDDTELIYVRSEKDIGESPKPGGVKKDGTPAYLQPFQNQSIQPMSKHAYIAYLPTVEFAGGITSATEIRNRWPDLSEEQKVQLVNTLYPKTKQNTRLAANVIKLLNLAIQGNNQGINESIEDTDYVQQITSEFIRKVRPMRSRVRDRKTIIGLLDRFFDKFAIPEEYFDDVYHLAARRLESEQPVDESELDEIAQIEMNPEKTWDRLIRINAGTNKNSRRGKVIGKIGDHPVIREWDPWDNDYVRFYVAKPRGSQDTEVVVQGTLKGNNFREEMLAAAPGNQVKAVELYRFLILQGFNIISDKEHTPGAMSVWRQLAKTPEISVKQYSRQGNTRLTSVGAAYKKKPTRMIATKKRGVAETKKQSTQQKFEKHLAKHGYDVAEKSKYWDQKIKDIDAQIAAWDAEMQRRKRENLPESIKRAIIEGGHSLEDFDYVAEKK